MRFGNTLLLFALVAIFVFSFSQTYATTDFGVQQVIDSTAGGGITVATADFNNDGAIDVLSGTSYGLTWHQNNGKGIFIAEHNVISLTSNSYKADVIDFDGDGAADIILNNAYSTLEWYKNDGSGNFGPPMFLLNMDAVYNFHIADVDGDGNNDILLANYPSNEVVWYKNNGNMQFDAAQVITNQVFSPWMVKSIDLDGDNDLDIISSSVSDDKIAWYENLGNGTFSNQNIISTELNDPELIYTFDLDSDGDQDVIAGSWLDPRILWFENDGNGNFSNFQVVTYDAEGTQSIHANDLDNDGDLDLMSAAIVNNKLVWYENFGNGVFSNQNIISDFVFGPHVVISEDIDNDFDIDILCASYNDTKVTWYENIKEFVGSGTVFYDVNQNGVQDEGELGMSNQRIEIAPFNQLTTTYTDGNFRFSNHRDTTYEVKWVEDSNWILTTDGTQELTLPNQSSNPMAFGLFAQNVVHNLQPSITSQPTRCNSVVPFYFTIANEGTQIENGVAELIIDGNTSVESYYPQNINMNNNTWEFNNLWPGNEQVVSMHMSVPTPEFIGDSISMTLNVYSTDIAGNYIDTITYEYITVIRCSYDPNDKQVTPAGIEEEHYTLLDETLFYTVRFQNTGNDYAYNVSILDTIDANLDLSTFTIVSSSHTASTNIDVNNRAVEFVFEDIMLPDSSTDLIGSQGYILYHIKPLEDVTPHTLVENTAHIIFDQNPAIVTNTTYNTLVDVLPDYIFPTAVCADSVDVYLDEYGMVELTSSLINQNSFDNMGISHFELNETTLSCYDIGYNEVNMVVYDYVLNSDFCTSIVNVIDKTAPLIESKDLHFDLAEGETLILKTDDLVNRLEDNCEIRSVELSKTEFTSNEVGEHIITIFAKDAAGNETSSDATVNISTITSSRDLTSGTKTTIYPNPFFETAILDLNTNISNNYDVIIRDISGKIVRTYYNQSSNQLEIKKRDLSKGVYFATVNYLNNNITSETIQLVVQ